MHGDRDPMLKVMVTNLGTELGLGKDVFSTYLASENSLSLCPLPDTSNDNLEK